MTDSLEQFLIPIDTGLTPAPEGWGELTREAKAELEAKLRANLVARGRAEVASRSYFVHGRASQGSQT